MAVFMAVVMPMLVRVSVLMSVTVRGPIDVNVELRRHDAVLVHARAVQVVTARAERGEARLDGGEVRARVEQRADRHVAADAAETIEIECAHVISRWRCDE